MSDIVGIIKEHQELEKKLSFELVNEAYVKLYSEEIPVAMSNKIKVLFEYEDLEELFYSTKEEEQENLSAALQAEEKYRDKVNEKNINLYN